MASSFDQGRFVKDNFTMRFSPVVSIAMVLVATHPHAWSQDLKGKARANGGRVLTVTGVAESFEGARKLSRKSAEQIQFDGKIFRSDIGGREGAGRRAPDI